MPLYTSFVYICVFINTRDSHAHTLVIVTLNSKDHIPQYVTQRSTVHEVVMAVEYSRKPVTY